MLRAGRAGLWGILWGESASATGGVGLGLMGHLLERTWIMFPIPLDFVPLFPAFPSPGAAAPAPGALSESLERGGRGQESLAVTVTH